MCPCNCTLHCGVIQLPLACPPTNPPGLALELASPLLPGAFLLLACLGSLCRAITGVAGGATRMALTQVGGTQGAGAVASCMAGRWQQGRSSRAAARCCPAPMRCGALELVPGPFRSSQPFLATPVQHFALQRNAADIAAKEGSQVGGWAACSAGPLAPVPALALGAACAPAGSCTPLA